MNTAIPSTNSQLAANESETSTPTLSTIVVTARKTDESIQSVPESITVVSPEAIKTMPLQPAQAIAQKSANVVWNNWAGNSSFFSIRGVSSLGTPVNNSDGSVSFNIDGVPGSMVALSNGLLDVQRVEVLRGPQGTLWGANSLGGAVNVITNPPNGTRDIRITGEIGSNGYRLGEAVIGGNVVPDALDGRMAVRFSHYDGDIANLHTGDDLGARDIQTFRGGLRFSAQDGTAATLTGSYSHDDGNAPFFLLRGAPDFPTSGALTKPDQDLQQASATLHITHDFDAFTLTSITGYQRNTSNGKVDSTDSLVSAQLGLPAMFIVSQPGATYDTERIYSQEFRLSSLNDAPYRWVTGASTVYSETARDTLGSSVPGVTQATALKTSNTGLFGDLSIPLSGRWTWGIGARANYDDSRVRYANDANLAALEGSSSTSASYLTGRTSLSYAWSDALTTYASVARGHSSRLYPLFGAAVNGSVAKAYPAGSGWTYEAGAKTKLFADRLELDASVFYNDIKNGILTYLEPTTVQFLTSYQSYRTKGFELQGRALLVDGLTFSSGVGYTHAELGSGSAGTSFSGQRVPNVPAWTANAGLNYAGPAGWIGLPGQISTSVDYQYVSSRPVDVANSFDLRAYSLVNLRAGWENARGDPELYTFARNLLDKRYEVYGASVGGVPAVMVGTGRIAGIGITESF